jgi:hypothetical protein
MSVIIWASLSLVASVITSIALSFSPVNVAFEMSDEELAQLCDEISCGPTTAPQECHLALTGPAQQARQLTWAALILFTGALLLAVIPLF